MSISRFMKSHALITSCLLHAAADAHDPVFRFGCRLPQHRSKQPVPQRDRIQKFSERRINHTPEIR